MLGRLDHRHEDGGVVGDADMRSGPGGGADAQPMCENAVHLVDGALRQFQPIRRHMRVGCDASMMQERPAQRGLTSCL